MSHQIVWIDIPVLDLDRALRFYSAVLGQTVEKFGEGEFSMGVFPHSSQDVAGCIYISTDGNAPSMTGPLIYLNADGRLNEAVEAAIAHGGRVLTPVHQIGPHGFRAIVADSEGNRVALHSPTQSA